MAQETTELSIQVKKDGKVVKDTTYQFEDEAEAKHAMKMMGHMNDQKHANTMVFISEDGKKTEIKEFHGDSLVWIEEGEHPHKAHVHGEHVIVMKSGDGETYDILIDEDGEGHDIVKKKEVKVIVHSDEGGSWTVDSKELKEIDEDENVFVIKSEDGDVDLEKIMEEHEGENVKVIVIKKGEDHDEDHDEDMDHDEDVEVEVTKKKVKK